MFLNLLKNLNLKKKFSACAAVSFLCIGCIIYFVIMPTIKDVKKIGEEIILIQNAANAKYNKIIGLKKMTADINKIEPEIATLQQIFIDKNNQLGFIQELEAIAKKNNVNQSINMGAVADKASLSLSASGEINNLYNYLLDLESLDYCINIKSISLSAGSASPRSIGSIDPQKIGNLSLSISAETYWR